MCQYRQERRQASKIARNRLFESILDSGNTFVGVSFISGVIPPRKPARSRPASRGYKNPKSDAKTPRGFYPVGSIPGTATPNGIFDLTRNSGEWVADFFNSRSFYEKAPPGAVLKDPTLSSPVEKDVRRVFKGICVPWKPELMTVTKRHGRNPLHEARGIGISFRCVKPAEPK